jgi:hypothetical protein
MTSEEAYPPVESFVKTIVAKIIRTISWKHLGLSPLVLLTSSPLFISGRLVLVLNMYKYICHWASNKQTNKNKMLFNMYQNVKPRSMLLVSHFSHLNAEKFDGCRYWSNLHNNNSQIGDFQDCEKPKSVSRPRFILTWKLKDKKTGQ